MQVELNGTRLWFDVDGPALVPSGVIDAFPAAKQRVPGLRMVVVAGPRIDPATLPHTDGLDVLPYVHELYRHLAACDLAVVQAD